MAYLLGYGTAVEWLRQSTSSAILLERYELPWLAVHASRTRLQQYQDVTKDLTRPLHLIATNRDARRPSAETICHLFSPSSGTYGTVRVARGVFCCGPELALVQMANVLDEEPLVFLGMELCGRYGISPKGKLFEREQTCDIGFMRGSIQKLGHVHGKGKALKALRRVLGGAASPMEAALALILHEPSARGGFGLPAPELNRSLPVTGHARTYWDGDTITPDLLWDEASLVIEYDSDTFHTTSHRIARDALRRDVLTELGYRVITVTTEHMKSARQIERIAQTVAQATGTDWSDATTELWSARVSFQARMRALATNPSELLGFSQFSLPSTRDWNPKHRESRR